MKAYLKIDGVVGSSTNPRHVNEIEIVKYKLEKTIYEPLYLTFKLNVKDTSTSYLISMLVNGIIIPEIFIIIENLNARGEFINSQVNKFYDCIITSMETLKKVNTFYVKFVSYERQI